MEEPSAARSRRRPWPLVGTWAAVLACAVAVGAWVQGESAARRVREGEALAGRAASLASRAREAVDPSTRVRLLAEALALLDALGEGGAAGAALRVDLAALLVRSDPGEEALPRAQALLEEAWNTPGISPPLRSRVARDRGAVELLSGEPEAAREWYERAAALERGRPGVPLEILRRTAPAGGADGR